MSSVHCDITLPVTVRVLETVGRHFSKFTVLGFLPFTANASVVPQHGSVHLGLRDFLFRFTPLDLPRSVNQQGHLL